MREAMHVGRKRAMALAVHIADGGTLPQSDDRGVLRSGRSKDPAEVREQLQAIISGLESTASHYRSDSPKSLPVRVPFSGIRFAFTFRGSSAHCLALSTSLDFGHFVSRLLENGVSDSLLWQNQK